MAFGTILTSTKSPFGVVKALIAMDKAQDLKAHYLKRF